MTSKVINFQTCMTLVYHFSNSVTLKVICCPLCRKLLTTGKIDFPLSPCIWSNRRNTPSPESLYVLESVVIHVYQDKNEMLKFKILNFKF